MAVRLITIPEEILLPEEILAHALDGPRSGLIDATAIYRFAQSPFAVWCDRFAPPEAKDYADEFTKLLFEQGREHEARVLSERFPNAQQVKYETPEEGFRLVLESMARGAPAIHGGPAFYLPEGLKGRVDILERRDGGPSIFGNYHYVVKEIKLAKNLQTHHRLQGAFYNYVIGKLQCFTPSQFYLINRDHVETTFQHDEHELLAVLAAIRRIYEGEKPPAIHGAGVAPWDSYTDQVAWENRDISLVAGIGPAKREKIVTFGLRT
ncbi:MAG: hypothetical protein ACREX8_14305, partial [Gammaproteobacteria bacterium]